VEEGEEDEEEDGEEEGQFYEGQENGEYPTGYFTIRHAVKQTKD